MPSLPSDASKPPLDPSLYSLSKQQAEFYKSQIGLEGDELKEHILAVQKKAYDIYGYACVRRFGFLNLEFCNQDVWDRMLKQGREDPNAIFLDLACFFGVAARKAISEGYPIERVICSDLESAFFDLGHEFFKTTSATYPLVFIAGNLFEDDFPVKHGHIKSIHVSNLFPLFLDSQQLPLAKRIGSLLSPEPGSMIFGHQVGKMEKSALRIEPNREIPALCHSPESFRQLWDGGVFKEGEVEVSIEMRLVVAGDERLGDLYFLDWCVMRLGS